MNGDVTQASVEAVMDVHRAVESFGKDIRAVMAAVKRDLNKINQEFEEACRRSNSRLQDAAARLTAASQALSQCRENCAPLQAAVREAELRFQTAKQQHQQNHDAWKQVQQEFARVRSAMGQLETTNETDVKAAGESVLAYARHLNQYLAVR